MGETYLILELCVTDLEKALSCWPRPLSESVAKALLHHLLSAVEHCHSAGDKPSRGCTLLVDAALYKRLCCKRVLRLVE